MHKFKAFRILIASAFLLASTVTLPAIAASDHQNGQIRVRWNTSNMYLNQSSYVEHEIIPTATTTFIDGVPFRWANQYHFDFCWQGTSKLTSSGSRCGYVGFGLGSKSGSNFYGNFDFAIFNAVSFVTSNSESNVTCRNSADAGYIDNTQTYYMNCWKGVTIQMGTPYILRVQWDPANSSNDGNWWSATLRNKNTNESITIGRIKAFGNSYQDQLSMLETVIFYQGEAVACDKVPVIDQRVLPVKSNSTTSTYLNYWTANCVKATAMPSKEFNGYYSIRLGGDNPESREPGYSNQIAATPSPSATKAVIKQKPLSPVFSGIKIANNTLNINVNLNSSDPDLVYLVAPKLTGDISQKIMADINGDDAKWSIKFDSKLLSGNIPISFFSVKNGETSAETKINYQIPVKSSETSNITKAPNSPTSISSKLVGRELIVTARVVTTGNASTNLVSLYSDALGIKSNKPIKGDLLNNSVIFSIPVTSSDLSKKIDLNLVASNRVGASKVARGSYALPVPKSPTFTTNENLVTVICTKGQTIRTFASKTCPPGWQTK